VIPAKGEWWESGSVSTEEPSPRSEQCWGLAGALLRGVTAALPPLLRCFVRGQFCRSAASLRKLLGTKLCTGNLEHQKFSIKTEF